MANYSRGRRDAAPPRYTDDQMLTVLAEFITAHGRPSTGTWTRAGMRPSTGTYITRFGTWGRARTLAEAHVALPK